MTTTYICGSARKVIAEEADRVRWCFECRKRMPHKWQLMDDVVQPSYYDPSWRLQCFGCGEDNTSFPGCGPL